MPEKRSKYDTDPLDADFARRTEKVIGRRDDTAPAPDEPVTQREAAAPEEPTQRLPGQYPTSYPSVFVPPAYQPPPGGYRNRGTTAPPPSQQTAMPPVQTPYAPPPVAHGFAAPPAYAQQPSSRHVAKLGIPENIANVLPYAPFYIGMVAGLIELLLVPRHESRTRFHAAQGLALHLAILALTVIFGFVGAVTGSGAGGKLLGLASFIFLVFSMWRVWEGRPHHLAPLDDATKYLNHKIEPRQ
jgi:uncharacterized membrane protein